jgi:hypothetical protein
MNIKRNIILVAGLTLASLFVALPGISSDNRIRAESSSKQGVDDRSLCEIDLKPAKPEPASNNTSSKL